MDIYEVGGDRRQYMDLLLLADESPRMIEGSSSCSATWAGP